MAEQIEGVSQETSTTEPSSFLDMFEAAEAEFAAEAGLSGEQNEPTEVPETGAAEEGEAATEGGTPTPEDTWDWQQYASKPVKVPVAGQEVEVTLEEMRNGYMRQADYTRKTQEAAEARRLAEWASNFQRNLREDPEGTLRIIQAAIGADPQAATPVIDPVEAQVAKLVEDDPSLAPIAQALIAERRRNAEFERRLEEQDRRFQETEAQRQQRQVIEQVEREIAEVDSKYDGFDVDAALQVAAQTALTLEEAHIFLLAKQGKMPVLKGQAPAPVAQETPPAPPSNTPAKEALAGLTTNTRTTGRPEIADDEWETFEELWDIMERTQAR